MTQEGSGKKTDRIIECPLSKSNCKRWRHHQNFQNRSVNERIEWIKLISEPLRFQNGRITVYLTNLDVLPENYEKDGAVISFQVSRSETDNYIFEPQNFHTFPYYGLIAYDKWNDGDCPLESISRPFKMVYEPQIVYIQSSWYENGIRSNPCNWQFTARPGFGMKIVFLKLNLLSSHLTVENSKNESVIG